MLEELELPAPLSLVGDDAFDDGAALFQTVCDRGLEGVVKRRSGMYRPGRRGSWVKVKNPGYWRRESELDGVRRSRDRRMRTELV